MSDKMKITGVAPLIAVPTFVYLIITAIISYLSKPVFSIIKNDGTVLIYLGAALIIPGVIMVAACGRRLLKFFDKNKLMTEGLYKIFRDPMYVAYLIFIIPGICLLFNSWLVLTTIILNYFLFSSLKKREHKYLEEKFGAEYKAYLDKVIIKFL
ncbi:MAG: isoprenylcysteine carboxylmethyltransferase family protein [Ignavibacteriales bacterium]|nr:isoprenylcysteine carboxylmethyltransferase family protein [Ignavibacteriales bacterium]